MFIIGIVYHKILQKLKVFKLQKLLSSRMGVLSVTGGADLALLGLRGLIITIVWFNCVVKLLHKCIEIAYSGLQELQQLSYISQ